MNFKFYDNTKVYAYIPAGIVTGGVELMHQLVDVINNNKGNAYVVYYGDKEHVIPEDYKKYNIQIAETIDDNESNILVLPEVNIRDIRNFKNIQIMVWWLSVDNYFLHYQASIIDTYKYFLRHGFFKALRCVIRKIKYIKKYSTFSFSQIRHTKKVIYNAYQSEYAADFLKKHKINNIYPLKDYINPEYYYENNINKKEDIVLYNPKKGLKFTNKLIQSSKDIKWVPIQNMTRSQVKELMLKAKLYIDFGYHPGKDRMPREAAMCGCCIITGKLGAAGFSGDISIDETKYKFDQRKKDIPIIIKNITNIMSNYETEIKNFENYRAIISSEKDEFEKAAIKLFC